MTDTIALVTGGTSGIGLCTAAALAEKGCRVYTFSRREADDERFTHIAVDVTDEAAVDAAVKQIAAKEDRIDIVVNCAGFGISGAIEFTELADAKRQFDVNFFGMVNVNKAVLPIMREQKHGRIVNISSVAAAVPIPFQAYYSASKSAINSYTCALGNEVRPYGITVCAVQPGDIKTNFTAARNKSAQGDEVYGGRIARSVAKMEHDEQTGMTPAEAGRFICAVALKKSVKPIYTIGIAYQLACLLVRILPKRWLNKLIYDIYAK